MDILLSADKNYIMPTVVAMKSISVNNREVHFHVIIDEGVSEKNKATIARAVNGKKGQLVSFYTFDSGFFENFTALKSVKGYISKAAYYRLFITDVLPSSIHKVLYVDGDVIIRKSLADLFAIDLSSIPIGAVTDTVENSYDFSRLGFDKNDGYFNSGVLLINLDYWREHRIKETFMKLIEQHPEKIVKHDQDVLNMVFHDNKLKLSMKYNVQNGFLWKKEYNGFGDKYDEYKDDLIAAITDPVIIHYCSRKKPWHVEDCNPYGYEFMKYYKQTEWRYVPLTHCNSNPIRFWIVKILRSLKLIGPARTDDFKWMSLAEIYDFKK